MQHGKFLPSHEAMLRDRLDEALAVIEALRTGAVDAVVAGPPGDRQVIQLEGADSSYRAFVETMHEGAATADIHGSLLYGNEALARLVNIPLRKLVGSSIAELVVREDRDALESLLKQSASSSHRTELRLIASGGAPVPALVSAVPLHGARTPGKVALLIADLSEREESLAMRRLLAQGSLLSTLGENLHSSLSVQEAYEVIGRDLPGLLPGTAGALMMFEDAAGSTATLRARWGELHGLAENWDRDDCQSVHRGQLHRVGDACRNQDCVHFGGTPPQRYDCIPLSAQGALIGVLHVQRSEVAAHESVAAEQQLVRGVAQHIGLAFANLGLRAKLKEQAIRDELTGMYNRYYEREWLEQELRRSTRYRRRFAVVMVDIDDFKVINDSHGHHVGDHVLELVAALFKRLIRGSDIACRHGGDEFLLLLLEASIDEATRKAQSLRDAFGQIQLQEAGLASGAVTASFGVAVFPDHAADGEGLLRAADAALYRAKARGGNRVEVAALPDSPCSRSKQDSES